jgi:hypothetical protein
MLKSERCLAFALLAAGAMVASGCGETHFKDKPRPPVPVQLTGVIRPNKVTISPNKLGAGPIIILVSNQTDSAHTITVDGPNNTHIVAGPINPLDTAKLQQTLLTGNYTVKAGSPRAVERAIKPATLRIGRERTNSSSQLNVP